MTSPMSPELELELRLTELLGTRDVHPDDRIAIQDAYADAPTWDDLPTDIRFMIENLEQLPRQAWDDPADVPDEVMNPE